MDNFVMKAGAKMAGNKFKKQVTKQFASNSNVDWTDLNYPPALKLIHYDISEVPEQHRLTMNLIHGYFGMEYLYDQACCRRKTLRRSHAQNQKI